MGRTACTEPQCLYSSAIPLLPLWAVRPVQSLSACTVELYLYSPYGSYGLYRASVPVQGCTLLSFFNYSDCTESWRKSVRFGKISGVFVTFSFIVLKNIKGYRRRLKINFSFLSGTLFETSLSLSLSLSVCLSIYLYLFLCLCLSMYLSISVCLSVYLFPINNQQGVLWNLPEMQVHFLVKCPLILFAAPILECAKLQVCAA
jgi:hypothetical protein